jgi:hypothetical protein
MRQRRDKTRRRKADNDVPRKADNENHHGIPRDAKGDPIFLILPPPMQTRYEEKLALCEAAWREGEPLAAAEAATLSHLYRQPIPAWLERAIVELAMARRSGRQAKRHIESRIHLGRYEAVRDFKAGALIREADNKVRQLPPQSWPEAYDMAAEMLAGTPMAGDAETMKASYCRVRRDLNARRFGKYFTLKDWRYANNGKPNPRAWNH